MDLAFTPAELALAAAFRDWLADNYQPPEPFGSPADEVAWGRSWQARLAADRWVGVDWPAEFGGRGAGPLDLALVNLEYGRAGAPQLVNRVGLNLVGPTLLAWGDEAQQRRFLPRILDGAEIWCQLFSEPDAGSDLASLRTTARPDGAGWRVSGQKVWTSYAQFARWGICLARTDPTQPGRGGLSYLVVDMTDPGIQIRPLTQLTGEAEFNQVFLHDVPVGPELVVGRPGDGWRVAGTTLAHERGTTFPIKEQTVHEVRFRRLFDAAAAGGALDDPAAGDQVARCYLLLRLLSLANLRTLSRLAAGRSPGPESSVVKLQWTQMTQQLSALWLQLAPGDPDAARQYLWSQAAGIAGGTSEVQRNIIGERILGLPRG